MQSLQESIRSAKELLSEAPSATITINNTPQGRQTLQITRDEFDELIAPAAEQAEAEEEPALRPAAQIAEPSLSQPILAPAAQTASSPPRAAPA